MASSAPSAPGSRLVVFFSFESWGWKFIVVIVVVFVVVVVVVDGVVVAGAVETGCSTLGGCCAAGLGGAVRGTGGIVEVDGDVREGRDDSDDCVVGGRSRGV